MNSEKRRYLRSVFFSYFFSSLMKQVFSVRFLAICGIVLSLSTGAYSQITFQVGAGGGYAAPRSDYAGSTADYYNGTSYGLSSGWEYHARARVGVLGLTVTGELSRSMLSNSVSADQGGGTIDVNHTITSLKAGPEFDLGMIPLVHPYIGANVGLNIFSGQATFHGVSKVPSETVDMSSTQRLGLGLTGGVRVGLGPILTLDLGLAYNVMNLSGTMWESTGNERVDSYRYLNDEKDPRYDGSDKHFIANSRAIHTLGINATLLVGL